jgi:hypothetical protein
MKVEVLKKACRYVFVGVRIAVDSGSRRGDPTSKVGWAECSSIKQVSFSSIALYNLCRSSWACSRFSSLHVPSHLRLEARADDVECCRLGVRGEWGPHTMKALIIPAARFNRPPFRTASSHVCAPRPSLRNRRSSSCISISKAHSARLRASASPVAAASSRASEQAACMARDGGMDLLPPPRPRDARLIGCGGWELSLERAAGVATAWCASAWCARN